MPSESTGEVLSLAQACQLELKDFKLVHLIYLALVHYIRLVNMILK